MKLPWLPIIFFNIIPTFAQNCFSNAMIHILENKYWLGYELSNMYILSYIILCTCFIKYY